VENAAWRYLCVARAQDVKTARAALIPITGDPRVPMMQIHALYKGNAGVEDVMASAGQSREAVFYAHLYIGLWYEAAGNARRAREHIRKAVEEKAGGYMGEVARVHLKLMR